MMIKPIDTILKKHFEQIHEAGTKRAANEYALFCSDINHKTLFEKAKQLQKEQARIDNLIEISEYPFYIENHDSLEHLLKQFANRTFLLNVNDSDALLESVYAGTYRKFLIEQEKTIKSQVPKYTYQQFANGYGCPYFLDLDDFYRISEADFYDIREWQATNVMKVVTHDYLIMVKKIQQQCRRLVAPMDFIKVEKDKIDNGLDKCDLVAPAIKKALCQLFVMKDIKTDEFNDDRLVDSFQCYISTELNWYHFSPSRLQPSLKKINSGTKQIAGNELTLFYVLNKINLWFESILAGQPWDQKCVGPDYETILDKTIQDAEAAVAVLDQNMELHAYEQDRTNEEIRDYLVEQFEHYRTRYKRLSSKFFFHVLSDEKKHLLKRVFVCNCFFGNDTMGQQKILRESIIIHKMTWAAIEIHCAVFDDHRFPSSEDNAACLEILWLMNDMVLSKDLYEELRNAMDDFLKDFHNYFLPIELHFLNQREIMREAFFKCKDRLCDLLDQAEPSSKILYLQSRLKQMRHREKKLEVLEKKDYFDKREFIYSKLFKEFLEIETEFINNTRDLKVDLPMLLLGKSSQTQPQTFEHLLTDEKQAFILQMLESFTLIKNGKSVISQRRKSAIRGIVESLRNHHVVPNLSIEMLAKMIALKIDMELKSPLDYSRTSREYQKKTDLYIKMNYSVTEQV